MARRLEETRWRSAMNTCEQPGIRELTATELDAIAGGTPSLGEIVGTVVK
jgi:hypothetical protein